MNTAPSRQPQAMDPAELAAIFATPLATLDFPARLRTYFAKKGLATVRQLAEIVPSSLLLEPNLGRKSISDARATLRAAFRMSWETLQRAAPGAPQPTAEDRTPPGEWRSFRARIPIELRETELIGLDLPTRIYTLATRLQLRTLDDLLGLELDELTRSRGVGRTTLDELLDFLRRSRGPSIPPVALPRVEPSPEPVAPDPLPAGSAWKDLFRSLCRDLPATERLVVTQRSGLAGPPPTLQEVGECLGVSRERIRQLEAKALERMRRARWVIAARAKLLEACPRPLTLLSSWDGGELFARGEDDEDAFAFLVNDLFDDNVRVVKLEGRRVLARVDGESPDALLRRMRDAAKALAFPVPRGELVTALASAIEMDEGDIAEAAAFLEDEWIIEDGEVRGYGATRRDETVAYVRAMKRPVTRTELDDRFGRAFIPRDLVQIDRGTFALPEQIPEWQRWQQRMPGTVQRLIEQHGPDRQWTTGELMELVVQEAELPAWMNEWTLGSILREVPEVRYLGRNVVALPASSGERLQIHELMEQLLREAGGPVPEDDLLAALRRQRGLSSHTWYMARMRRPFLLMGDGKLGLSPRDDGAPASVVNAFFDEVFAQLDERQVGINAGELRAVAAKHAAWDAKLYRSLLRHDPRFRLTQGGAVGLAEWESARVASQADVLMELLIEHDGIVSVELARELLPTESGEPIERGRLGLLASSIRARLVGASIEWMPESDEPRSQRDLLGRVAAALPEAAASRFVAFADDVQPMEVLRARKAAWLETMRAEARRNANVEAVQVERLHAAAERVLAIGEKAADAGVRAVCSAAVDYLAAMDDGFSDTALGGLDDDERVLEVVVAELR